MNILQPRSSNSIANLLLYGLIIVSIAFGMYKQGKTAFRSIDSLIQPHKEPGADARILRDAFDADVRENGRIGDSIGYSTDRTSSVGRRDPEEFFFEAQYAFAPVLINRRPNEGTGYLLLDYENKAAGSKLIQERRLKVLAAQGTLILAKRSQSGAGV